MILHGYYRSSASFRVRIGLNLKMISFETIAHHLRRGEQQRPDYLKLNPQGLVPTLVDEGHALTQSLAILEYLDEQYPDPAFFPPQSVDRAYVRGLAHLIACDIHPLDNLRVLKYLRTNLGQDQLSVKSWYNHWISLGFDAMEARLSSDARTGAYCFGDRPSLADICLVPQVVNAGTFDLDLSPYPTIHRIFAACMQLPAFADARPDRQPDAE